MSLCECGCGQEVRGRFMPGHHMRVRKKIEGGNMAPVAVKDVRLVKKLTRVVRMWECQSCHKVYGGYPDKCVCGQFPPVFAEKQTLLSDELPRKTFVVNRNFLFETVHVDMGTWVSLPVDDQLTKELIERELVSEVKD